MATDARKAGYSGENPAWVETYAYIRQLLCSGWRGAIPFDKMRLFPIPDFDSSIVGCKPARQCPPCSARW